MALFIIFSPQILPIELVMRNFMLERLLERISVSKYRQNFVLKGGFLIAVLANVSLSTQQSREGEIRKNIIDADLIEGIIALLANLFIVSQFHNV